MMDLRKGDYTLYKDYIVEVKSINEALIFSPSYFMLSFERDRAYPLPEFQNSGFDTMFRYIQKVEVKNAFRVETKALYRGEVVDVDVYNPLSKTLGAFTHDRALGKKLKFFEVLGKIFVEDILLSEVEKIWEVRSRSQFNLPIPEGLPLHHEINTLNVLIGSRE